MSLLFENLSQKEFTLKSNFAFNDFHVYDSSIVLNGESVKVSVPTSINSEKLFPNKPTASISNLNQDIEKILNDNGELLISCMMLVSGTTYSNSSRLIKNIKDYLKLMNPIKGETTTVHINMGSENIFQLITWLCKYSLKNIILAVHYNNRNLLLASVFLDLLFGINSKYKDNICLLPVDNDNIYSESLVATEIPLNNTKINQISMSNKNRKTGFVILEDCDIFSATVSCCETMPNFCFVQESIYEEFLIQLKQLKNKSKMCALSDKNRNLEMRFCTDKNRNKLNKLGELIWPNLDQNKSDNTDFVPAFMTDKIQPSNDMYIDGEFNEICTFLLTFRHMNELISLLSTVPILNRSELYLWSENIQMIHSLNNLIDWEHVFVNSTIYDFLSIPSTKLYFDKSNFLSSSVNLPKFNVEKLNSYFKMLVPSKTFNTIGQASKMLDDLKLQSWNDEITMTKIEHISMKPRGNIVVCCDDKDSLLRAVIISAVSGNKTVAITGCDIDNQLGSLWEQFDLSKSVKFVNKSELDIVNAKLSDLPIHGMIYLDGILPNYSKHDINCHFPVLIAHHHLNLIEFVRRVNRLCIPLIQNFDTK